MGFFTPSYARGSGFAPHHTRVVVVFTPSYARGSGLCSAVFVAVSTHQLVSPAVAADSAEEADEEEVAVEDQGHHQQSHKVSIKDAFYPLIKLRRRCSCFAIKYRPHHQ